MIQLNDVTGGTSFDLWPCPVIGRLLMRSPAGHSPAGPPLPLWKLDLFLQQHLSLGDTGMIYCNSFTFGATASWEIGEELSFCCSVCSLQFGWKTSASWRKRKPRVWFPMPYRCAQTLRRWESFRCHRTLTQRLFLDVHLLLRSSLQHFFTSFGARDRTYMMMFRLWQNALLDKVWAQYMSIYSI